MRAGAPGGGSDVELERLTGRGAASGREDSAPARRLAAISGARAPMEAVEALEALRGVLWEALLDQLHTSSFELSSARLLGDVADRLAYVCAVVLAAAVDAMLAPGASAPGATPGSRSGYPGRRRVTPPQRRRRGARRSSSTNAPPYPPTSVGLARPRARPARRRPGGRPSVRCRGMPRRRCRRRHRPRGASLRPRRRTRRTRRVRRAQRARRERGPPRSRSATNEGRRDRRRGSDRSAADWSASAGTGCRLACCWSSSWTSSVCVARSSQRSSRGWLEEWSGR